MVDVEDSLLSSANGKIRVFCKLHLIDISCMIEYSLRFGVISFPKNHHSISPSTQKVQTWRVEMHVPDCFCVKFESRKQDIQSKAPQFDSFISTSSDSIELVLWKWNTDNFAAMADKSEMPFQVENPRVHIFFRLCFFLILAVSNDQIFLRGFCERIGVFSWCPLPNLKVIPFRNGPNSVPNNEVASVLQ